MLKRPTIAGVVLTLNEERDLARALRSLTWCDELLVVDSGSTDQTQAVAESFGAKFVQHIQKPPFLITEQRNWSLDSNLLSSDWVLFLDADEEVGIDLAEHILSLITLPNSYDCYELTPRYWFFGKWLKRTQGYPNWHPRLLRRERVRFLGGVWETFDSASPAGRINSPYEHYAFSKGLDSWIERHQRYSTWESRQIIRYLAQQGLSIEENRRSFHLRRLATHFWYLRPIGRFLQKYLLQAGFTEGWQGLLYSLMMFIYEIFTVIRVAEHLHEKSLVDSL